MAPATQHDQAVEWSVASRPLPGQLVSGDLHVVVSWSGGVLVAVVDGLGHGEEATAAARIAASVLEQRAGEPVINLVQHCHRALQRTRGVVMTVVTLNCSDNTLTALGVGNVETVVRRANPDAAPQHESVLLRGGVVGYQLPALQTSVLPIAPGDVVVFGTDGVREDFSDLINPAEPPPQLVEKIMAQKFRGTDDGLVLACKYLGEIVKPKAWTALVTKYQLALGAYVARGDEEALQSAYELGRKALNMGVGVVDVGRLHQEALVRLVSRSAPITVTPRWAKSVETFLMEVLSAFEVAHRGFRDACDRLRRLNDTLKERHHQLAVSIKKLAKEVARRKNAQKLLQESELKFRSVVESAQDGIITVDSNGRLVAINHGGEMLFGYRRKELMGKSVTRLIPKPLREAALFTLKCLAEGGEQQHLKRPIQSVGLHRDRSEFSLEFTLATWKTRSGVFFTGVVRDIRERKQAELALRESREHYIRLFQEARAMEENLRELSNKVLTVQEEERKHISRELHDEIGQALTAVNVSIAMLRSHAAGDETFRKKVDTAQQLLEQSMSIVHQFARELRPPMLDHLGPVAALQNYVKSFTERTGIKTELEGAVRVEELNNQQGTVLYRIAQESLTNVFKHAQATRVKIRLRQLPRAVCMEIVDNGCAFSVPNPTNGSGRQPLGLLGMKERVRLVNGEFAIESVPKRGTTVRVQIPLPPAVPEPVVGASLADARERRQATPLPKPQTPDAAIALVSN